jgi:hypothetical protein
MRSRGDHPAIIRRSSSGENAPGGARREVHGSRDHGMSDAREAGQNKEPSMRTTSKILFGTFAVCVVAQGHHAFAQPTDPTPPPSADPTQPSTPLPTPDPSNPAVPASPPPSTDPPPAPSPPDAPTDSTSPTPPPPPPPPSDASPTGMEAPATTTTTTTTTTTNGTGSTTSGSEPTSYGWLDDRLLSRIGIAVVLGGGATGFVSKTMRDMTSSVGGLWDLRVTLGSHTPLALEISYVGSATNIGSLPSGRSGTLLGTAVEGTLRYDVLPHAPMTPYLFGGVGWQRYDVIRTDVTLSANGMNDKDNLIDFPVGLGLSYRMGGFVVDVRGTFRFTTDEDLVLKTSALSPTSKDFESMRTWEGSAAVGYEF